jgi:hypothetical protein
MLVLTHIDELEAAGFLPLTTNVDPFLVKRQHTKHAAARHVVFDIIIINPVRA